MYGNIIFLGGIHGVGKGTLAYKINKDFSIEHLTASELLKWADVNADPKNKLVADIPSMQDRLIQGLESTIVASRKYLLDGHFCLFDSDGNVEYIPFETFSKINPILISVLTADHLTIVNRLAERDGKLYSAQLIQEMQEEEVNYGRWVADELRVPFMIIDGYSQSFINVINEL